MPELPEVETVRLQLVRSVTGKEIKKVDILHPKSVGFDTSISKRLPGSTIGNIDRIGKLLIFTFKKESNLFLLIHLKMTGQLIFRDKKGTLAGGGHSMSELDYRKLPGRHTRVAIHFTDGSSLFFNDMRLFGYIKLASLEEMEAARAGFGPEPIATDFDTTNFVEAVQKRRAPIKAILLDQSFVAGLGNIYVDEALWRAKIKPTRIGTDITEKEAMLLLESAGNVMREAIAQGGTTFQHFVDTADNKGNFTAYLQVFGKQNTPCSRCGTSIEKIRLAGRGTHYCPQCQK